MTRLWLPYTVDDLPGALTFYRDLVGLPVVDGWRRDGEEGVVLAVESGFVELASPAVPGPVPVAFEVSDVDAVFARMAGVDVVAPPHRYPRGHHGFEVRGPAGAVVMVWSER
ncbi:VOC family protein [Actinophytocola oryzae]|uniref:Putative enzyme related to lactoylglutathione lyase n=1 Tax=Actinophytocola oryzae TaxID=502181 RepID=A0A4R7VW25_9PSEU|nr:VOC family protein [Actinophytocola oryzae]TDV54092.1 putative enzyme related to lactoylglutathione lyase [Actinophytocola oryzae]